MPEVIISDASCLIGLANAGRLELLHDLYGQVLVTAEVVAEFGEALPGWAIVSVPTNTAMAQQLMRAIGRGEGSAMALALETEHAILIVDDLKARKAAIRLKIPITGTMGVLVEAKKRGIIPLVRPVIEELQKAEFRMSGSLMRDTLSQAGE